MKNVHINFGQALSRRTVLRGAGVALGLPMLDAMTPALAGAAEAGPKSKRFVAMTLSLGLHGPNWVPKNGGREYTASPYLKPLGDLRDDFSVISGTSHPGVTGGHRAEGNILNACPNEGGANSRSTVSIDQALARQYGHLTRFPSLVLNTGGDTSPCYTENGAMIPAERDPRRLFAQLFVDDSTADKERRSQLLRRGRSILDVVGEEAKKLQGELGPADKDRLDDWFTSIRETERRLAMNEDWVHKPKPKVEMKSAPTPDKNDISDIERAMLDLIFLALRTDSTRYAALHVSQNTVSGIEGVNESYHSLSHHGKSGDKLKQLSLVEGAVVKQWGNFVRKLKEAEMLDDTTVLLTSNLGNASSHDNRNMPVLCAGGGFDHGKHLSFDQKRNYPLSNLFLSMAQQGGLEIDQFSTTKTTMKGLEPTI